MNVIKKHIKIMIFSTCLFLSIFIFNQIFNVFNVSDINVEAASITPRNDRTTTLGTFSAMTEPNLQSTYDDPYSRPEMHDFPEIVLFTIDGQIGPTITSADPNYSINEIEVTLPNEIDLQTYLHEGHIGFGVTHDSTYVMRNMYFTADYAEIYYDLTSSNGVDTSSWRVSVVHGDYPILTGSVSISPTAKYGDTLTANTSQIDDEYGAFTYQWVRKSASGATTNIGTNASTYTVAAADIGSKIYVNVSTTAQTASIIKSNETSTVEKADCVDQTAVSINMSQSFNANKYTITIQSVPGCEYSFDGTNYSDDNTKEILADNTLVNGYIRKKGSSTHKPGNPTHGTITTGTSITDTANTSIRKYKKYISHLKSLINK